MMAAPANGPWDDPFRVSFEDPHREPPEDGPGDEPPLVRYLDAVVDALMDLGLGVRDHEADDMAAGPSLGIDLDPIDSRRTPVMVWTPAHGWRIGVHDGHKVDSATIRYVGIDAVPYPRAVASVILRWTVAPDHLLATQPLYPDVPRAELDRALAARGHWDRP